MWWIVATPTRLYRFGETIGFSRIHSLIWSQTKRTPTGQLPLIWYGLVPLPVARMEPFGTLPLMYSHIWYGLGKPLYLQGGSDPRNKYWIGLGPLGR